MWFPDIRFGAAVSGHLTRESGIFNFHSKQIVNEVSQKYFPLYYAHRSLQENAHSSS